jgi:RNA polymerase sigma-70 factor, ECF subfamily
MGKYAISVQEPVANCAGVADHFSAPGLVTFLPVQDILHVPDRLTTFHELYNRYASDVYRFAHWLTGNPDDARDITSETFVRAWTAAEEPRLESVKAYLFTIARNLHRKQWRRQSRLVPLDETMADMPDPAAAPDQAAGDQEDFQRTMAALQTLPELYRTVLLLRAEEDLSYADIAAATGLSVVAAKVRVFRARAKLAALLQTNSETKL